MIFVKSLECSTSASNQLFMSVVKWAADVCLPFVDVQCPRCQTGGMDINKFGQVVMSFPRVHHSEHGGLQQWRLNGRLIARQLHSNQVVIRSDFTHRSELLNQYPRTFSVPRRFEKHMMIVVDLPVADEAAIDQAVTWAWHLQSTPK